MNALVEKYAGPVLLIGGAVLVLWFVRRGVAGVAQDVAQAGINAATGLATGAVVGVGQVVGIPETNADACQLALDEGRYWDASFACPASKFVASVPDWWSTSSR
jgi:hypothetical protein